MCPGQCLTLVRVTCAVSRVTAARKPAGKLGGGLGVKKLDAKVRRLQSILLSGSIALYGRTKCLTDSSRTGSRSLLC